MAHSQALPPFAWVIPDGSPGRVAGRRHGGGGDRAKRSHPRVRVGNLFLTPPPKEEEEKRRREGMAKMGRPNGDTHVLSEKEDCLLQVCSFVAKTFSPVFRAKRRSAAVPRV